MLEVEHDGVVARSPGEGPLGPELLAATNHMRRKAEPQSCSRYDQVLRSARDHERRFDRDELWALGTRLRLPQVVCSLLVEPEARRLGVWLRAPGQDAQAEIPPVVHEWSSLLGVP